MAVGRWPRLPADARSLGGEIAIYWSMLSKLPSFCEQWFRKPEHRAGRRMKRALNGGMLTVSDRQ
jgi:hypothetical protein